MSNISLWQIDEAIIGLSEIIESPETTDEEKSVALQEIRRWVKIKVHEVDYFRAQIRHAVVMAEAAKFEAMTMKAKAEKWESRAKRLKDIGLAVMQEDGLKRLEGQSGVLRTQAAGGKQALVITRDDLVPDELCDTTVTFRTRDWRRIIDRLDLDVQEEIARKCKMVRAPNSEAIRKVLETPCDRCDGAPSVGTKDECQHCNGTGRKIVPGAELSPRSTVLRVE